MQISFFPWMDVSAEATITVSTWASCSVLRPHFLDCKFFAPYAPVNGDHHFGSTIFNTVG
jgi:hypothetical protein